MTRRVFSAFGGSRCEIIILDGSCRSLEAAHRLVRDFEWRLTRFDPGSELMRFNASAGRRVSISPLLRQVLLAALEAHRISDGVVNAAVHEAVVAAGYDRTIEEVRRRDQRPALTSAPPRPELPSAAARKAARPSGRGTPASTAVAPLPEVLDVGTRSARLAPGHALDMGAVAKGWLADRICEGFENAAVNLGGDLRARGRGPGGDGWVVAMCDGSRVLVTDGGVATSGISGRRWNSGHHLVDPRSGRCADTDVAAVSVAAPDALTAEILATAAAVLGSAAAPGWLRPRGAARWAIVRAGMPSVEVLGRTA